jgi:hypothetical protein
MENKQEEHMSGAEIAAHAYNLGGNGQAGWQAVYDTCVADNLVKVTKWLRQMGLQIVASDIEAGKHLEPPPKTPGQKLRDALPADRGHLFNLKELERAARAVLEHSKK